MKFFLDTANLDEIRQARAYGLIDGVTTNPTLFSRESGDWRTLAEKICRETPGPVSLEVIGQTTAEMIAEANELVKIGPNVVVKIPMTLDGMAAVKELTAQAIDTNVTLVFHPLQALLAAKAGATYVSPFVGRLDALSQNGMEVVEQIVAIFKNYDFAAQVLVASVRHPLHVLEAALCGADVATIPFAVIRELSRHPLTDKGLETFMKDWEKVQK
ncbi:fructose-6-phosphate aldolase [Desulfovibrio sulfodismutans]|uniref:Probable transaldolase n=1 Tax=Desulfolutivibrio sulfodismutans TaxID=63561 RepID=A0A7K3NHG1_9BACT|nr:fructose-6-phosphate aldolase [Desulfolutivibrio sulfodismutans]NDY55622.1 fructose-6-phosphate aldolase [Desulfolutivibrio sulfodismutans]QLA11678.1 fructose-6-phosphate aldolase [Desulfolutivibrio sulfodismutans DSM 3696]